MSTRKKSNQVFKDEVYNLVGDEYTFLENYIANRFKIIVKHNICKNTYSVRPNDFLMGKRCPVCSGKMKKNSESFKKEVYDLVGSEFLVLGEYVNAKTKIKMKHTVCNYEFEVKTSQFLHTDKRCPYCAGNVKHKFEDVKHAFELRNYILLEKEYMNAHTKMKYICSKHPDIVQEVPFHSFKNKNSGCMFCGQERTKEGLKLSYEFVYNQFLEKGFQLLEKKYINARTKMECVCLKHPDEKLFVAYANVLNCCSCKYCWRENSKGELHHNWQGGITPLALYLRDYIKGWTLDSLKSHGFKCAITGVVGGKLHVHHVNKNFSDMLKETLNELSYPIYNNISDYKSEQLIDIKNLFLKKHYEVLGAPLKKELHQLFHVVYGIKNNTPEQFEEFKQDYLNGKYKEMIAI